MSLQDRIRAYLEAHQSMVISGAAAPGQPYAGTTCYVPGDGLGVHFFVFKNSEKHQLVNQGEPFCLVIDEGFKIPFQGLELRGTAAVLGGEAAGTAQRRLAATFPKLGNVWGHPAILVCAFTPDQVVFHDWTVKVGHSEIWEG